MLFEMPPQMSSEPKLSEASRLLGSTPPPAARPVSLAVRHYLQGQYRHDNFGVVIAVSGGADSVALAAATIDVASRRGVPTLTVTVDHGVRPEAAVEAEAVAEFMRYLGADETLVLQADSGAGSAGPEGNARNARYGLLTRATADFAASRQLGHVELFLGHTADDQAETVLLRLGRGAGTRSLSAMRQRQPLPRASTWDEGDRAKPKGPTSPPVAGRMWWSRPLLGVRRADTEGFCHALNLPTVDDPSNRADGPWRNSEGGPLRRAAIREGALPALSEALGHDVVPALARTARLLADDDDALNLWAERIVAEDFWHWGGVPIAVRRRALRLICFQAGVPAAKLRASHVEDLDDLISKCHGQGPVRLPGEIWARRQGGTLKISPAANPQS